MASEESAPTDIAVDGTPESPLRSPTSPVSPKIPIDLPRLPSLRSTSDPETRKGMTMSSTPLGNVNAARRPPASSQQSSFLRSGGASLDALERAKAYSQSRQGVPTLRMGGFPPHALSTNQIPLQSPHTPNGPLGPAFASPGGIKPGPPGGPLMGSAGGIRLPPNARPSPQNWASAPQLPNARMPPKMGGLAAKRGLNRGLKLSDIAGSNDSPQDGGKDTGAGDSKDSKDKDGPMGSAFNKYSEFVDTKAGTLNFKNKAVIHGGGIDFSSGQSFKISLDEVHTLDELGKGNYGTVYKVRHSRPQMRVPGQGLRGNRMPSATSHPDAAPIDGENLSDQMANATITPQSKTQTTGVVMAMKEIRLELDESKFAAIIMELDILHRCVSPFIVDFYGAFFQEGAVYICMEFMDGGSIDKLYGDGIPEAILKKITLSTVMGLKSLKEDHNIIHRDVKPTNILANTRGQIKICDFGVSGNLVASIAKTNIGCQSYMAPERISSGGIAQAGANPGGGTYSVQSDIWSLGLTVIECAMGRYPYPPETYNNIFSQLSAIVDGDPPDLPEEGFTDVAKDFVRGCLNKIPNLRPTYAMLVRHAWLSPLMKPPTISEEDEEIEELPENSPTDDTEDKEVAEWVVASLERRKNGQMGKSEKPALHAAPLDAVPSPKINDPEALIGHDWKQ
ncbi:MAG: hypothetical protein M1834_000144 [Cirrosporium novae-zelandiae]|nr:MAG: hypothetical protein M1834_000144 [Cirrosporium novae-zelandiae]